MMFFRSLLAVVESPITLGSVAVTRDAPPSNCDPLGRVAPRKLLRACESVPPLLPVRLLPEVPTYHFRLRRRIRSP